MFVVLVSTAPVISSWLRFKSLVNSHGGKNGESKRGQGQELHWATLDMLRVHRSRAKVCFELIRWGAPELLNWSVLLKKKCKSLRVLGLLRTLFHQTFWKLWWAAPICRLRYLDIWGRHSPEMQPDCIWWKCITAMSSIKAFCQVNFLLHLISEAAAGRPTLKDTELLPKSCVFSSGHVCGMSILNF